MPESSACRIPSSRNSPTTGTHGDRARSRSVGCRASARKRKRPTWAIYGLGAMSCAAVRLVPDHADGSRFIRVPRSLADPILAPVGDEEFADYIASSLASLPGVLAVSLGGSRASGANRPASDWDLAGYYPRRFDPYDPPALGWPRAAS